MPRRAPLHMRDALAERNSINRWKGVTLSESDKALLEQALSEKLERQHNSPVAYTLITQLIAKVRNLPA